MSDNKWQISLLQHEIWVDDGDEGYRSDFVLVDVAALHTTYMHATPTLSAERGCGCWGRDESM